MGDPVTRATLLSLGLSDGAIDRRLHTGALTAVRRGVLVTGPAGLDVQLRAVLLAHPGRDLVVSHTSAARVFGLPRPLGGWPPPEFTSRRGPAYRRPDARITVAHLVDRDVVRLGDLVVTSAARTVVDCARTLPERDALAIADAALRRHLVTAAELAAVVASQARWPGIRRAKTVLALADPRRETPLESWSAWAMHLLGMPQPLWQVDVYDADGRFVARGDCAWPGVIGEADGKSKYRLAAAERGGAGAETLFGLMEEQLVRQQKLRDLRLEVVRWGAADVLRRDKLTGFGRRLTVAIETAMHAEGEFLGTMRQR